jgi:tetratricopeptide (TPR) repeat protein
LTNLRATLEEALRLHQAGNLAQAETIYRQILQQHPGQPDALNLLGVMANRAGQTELALDLIGQAVARLPNEPDFHGNYANALQAAGRVPESMFHYREAIRLRPDSATYHVLLSEALQQLGETDEALALALQAAQLDPQSAEPLCILGDLAAEGYYTLTDADLGRMQELLGQGRQSAADACLLCFTLAAHRERSGNYDEAFAYYRRGNEFKLQVYRNENKAFDQQRHHALTNSLMGVFTPEYLDRTRKFGIDSAVPVFVVGLVRSGTTLVEQILASHPEVHGAGERKEIDELATTLPRQLQTAEPYPACLGRLEAGMARYLAYGYLQRLARSADTASRIVDKMPHNYLHLGLISVLFPRAHIIHCRRNPMDVCASAYFQNFKWMPYAASLDDIAFYHREYTRLMAHWRQVLPMPIHEVIYEDLVADAETVSRKLVAACGLEWDQRCLTYYRTRRSVQTASKLQVRQPIYRRAVERWKPFASHLEPLRQALGLAEEHQNLT